MLATTHELEVEEGRVVTRSAAGPVLLDALSRGSRGRIAGLSLPAHQGSVHVIAPEELERRLLEIGFVEGARIEILHEGLIGRDPIVVALDSMRVALRRREARAILVRLDEPSVGPNKPVA
jgi:ferrous iron transport protein A